jgi:TatD DNase family protein
MAELDFDHGAQNVPQDSVTLIDTHAHLDDPRLAEALPKVLERARLAQVRQVIAIATTADSSEKVLRLSNQYSGLFASVGIQPNHVAETKAGDWERVVSLARSASKVVAIGETGLDRYWDYTPFPQQQEMFDRHLTLAEELQLPVVIHCRDCEHDIVEQLKKWRKPIRGVLHSFTGSWENAQAFLELGLFLSFAGMVTYKNRKLDALRDVAVRVPLERLLVETDSPYLSPHPYRGQTNEPARVEATARFLAELRGLEPAALAEVTTSNARQLFGLPDEFL